MKFPVWQEGDPTVRVRLVKSIVDIIVIELLKNLPKSASDLQTEIDDLFKVSIDISTIYSSLRFLLEQGLIETYKVDGVRVFRLTERGREFTIRISFETKPFVKGFLDIVMP